MLKTIYKYLTGYKITDNKALLNKAYHSAYTAYKQTPADVRLHFFCVFINIEKGEYELAHEFLNNISPYKNYYKNNEPVYFAFYQFLLALFELKSEKHRSSKKNIRLLEEYSEGRTEYVFDLLLGMLRAENGENEAAFALLKKAYEKGCRTPYLYIRLHEYYSNNGYVSQGTDNVFISFLKWCVAHEMNIEKIIQSHAAVVKAYCVKLAGFGERLYSVYPYDFILEAVCERMIRDGDYTEKAFFYYKEALTKQVFTVGINNALIRSAYKNGIEDVGRYSLTKFLSGGPPLDIMPYIYHLMLTSKKHRELLPEYKNEIIQFALYSLENNLRGRYYNSVYKYLIDVSYEQEIKRDYLSKAEIYLISDLFSYNAEVLSDGVKYLWIQEKERKGMRIYETDGLVTRIKAISENFTYYCLGERQRRITAVEIKVTKLIENADIKLYQHFFRRRLLSPELNIALAKHHLSLEKPTAESVEVFERTLAEADISYSFRMTLLAALGSCYYAQGDYDKASGYYHDVDINCLSGYYVEQALLVFINAKDYGKAVDVIVKKQALITDKSLFYAIKQLNDEKYYPLVADAAYDLLLKSWYDKLLLDITLKYYATSRKELQDLSFSLSRMSVQDTDIDEVILNTSVYTHEFDAGAQKTFVKLYNRQPQNRSARDFVYYCAYEMIINSKKPEYEAVEVLENIFRETGEHYLGYALCHLYLGQGITTLSSDYIIEQSVGHLQEDGLLFPVYKLIQDKAVITPYIEKNQPFFYRTLPNKEVYLSYKTDGETEYREKKMAYWRFGIYTTTLLHFYGDKITYYFSEKIQTGSIASKESAVHNNRLNLRENTNDPYYSLNNALIYEQMFKYDMVEGIISERLREAAEIKGTIL